MLILNIYINLDFKKNSPMFTCSNGAAEVPVGSPLGFSPPWAAARAPGTLVMGGTHSLGPLAPKPNCLMSVLKYHNYLQWTKDLV